MKEEQAEQLRQLLDIPSGIRISELPYALFPPLGGAIVLLKGKKRQWENTRDFIDYNVSLLIEDGKFIIRKSNFLNDEYIEKEPCFFTPIFLEDEFDSLFLEDCNMSFCQFLIDRGYKDILKKKVLEQNGRLRTFR